MDDPENPVTANSATLAWTRMQARITKALGIGDPGAVPGVEYFGLTQPQVCKLPWPCSN